MPNRPPKKKDHITTTRWGTFERELQGKDFRGNAGYSGKSSKRFRRRHHEEVVGASDAEINAVRAIAEMIRGINAPDD